MGYGRSPPSSHTTLPHTIFHIQLCHTPSFSHHLCQNNFVTHTIFHIQLCHTIFVTHHLCHTPSFRHHLSHIHLCHSNLSHTPSFTHNLSHTIFLHTIFHLSHIIFLTPSLSHTHNFVTDLRFAWQGCYLATSTGVLRGRRGTYGTGLGGGALGSGVALMAMGWVWWRA